MRPEWHREAIRLYDSGLYTQKELTIKFGKSRHAVAHALNRSMIALNREFKTSESHRKANQRYAAKNKRIRHK